MTLACRHARVASCGLAVVVVAMVLALPAAGSQGQARAGANVDCDGVRTDADVIAVLDFAAGARRDGGECPLASPDIEINAIAADLNIDGKTDLVDALLIAQCNEGHAHETCDVQPAQTPIPAIIIDGNLFDLEGNDPDPLVNPSTLEFVPLETRVTTPNGNGWRHEYKIEPSQRVAMAATYEDFVATTKVDLSDGAKTIVAQHHAGGTGTIMKLYVSDSSESGFFDSTPANGVFDVYVRLRNTSGVEEKKPLGTVQSGDSFTFRVINNFGVVTVSAFGQSLETEVEDSEASYFKFGNYLQSQDPDGNAKCGESGDSDSFRDCFEQLGITVATVTMTDVAYTRILGAD